MKFFNEHNNMGRAHKPPPKSETEGKALFETAIKKDRIANIDKYDTEPYEVNDFKQRLERMEKMSEELVHFCPTYHPTFSQFCPTEESPPTHWVNECFRSHKMQGGLIFLLECAHKQNGLMHKVQQKCKLDIPTFFAGDKAAGGISRPNRLLQQSLRGKSVDVLDYTVYFSLFVGQVMLNILFPMLLIAAIYKNEEGDISDIMSKTSLQGKMAFLDHLMEYCHYPENKAFRDFFPYQLQNINNEKPELFHVNEPEDGEDLFLFMLLLCVIPYDSPEITEQTDQNELIKNFLVDYLYEKHGTGSTSMLCGLTDDPVSEV